ncbi:MAG: SGNH/GDSL hydrolase family protein [Bacteroidota bacterium]
MLPQAIFITSSILFSPILPLLAIKGKKIKEKMPNLPDAGPPYSSPQQDDNGLRILGLGESTISGVGVAKMDQSITAYIARRLEEQLNQSVRWEVVARSGYTAQQVREELVPKISDTNYDLLVIGLGGNDTFKLTSPNRWKKNLHLLLKDLRQMGLTAPIVFMNVPPVHEFPIFPWYLKLILGRLVRLHGYELQNVVRRHEDVYYIKEKVFLEDMKRKVPYPTRTRDYFSDGVHPSELTYRLWGEDIADYILSKGVL